jgi:N-acetylglucosaminyl-diphospho-decaprenol L-rhamnosyltransferase
VITSASGRSATPRVSVSVVTYNNAQCLPAFLDCLRAQKGVCWEAFFFDNGSCDATGQLIQDAGIGEFFVSETNVGYGRAHNYNSSRAAGEYLLIVNPDLQFDADLFSTLVGHMDRNPQRGFLGPQILEGPDHRPFPPRLFYPGEGMIPLEPGLRREEIAWLNGCCLLVQREAFEMVHGFDTDYFLYQAEADLCLRARRAGYRLGHIDDAVVYHEQRESQRDLSEYDYSRRIFEGNAVFWGKHYASSDVVRMLRFQHWMCGVLLALGKTRDWIPLPQHLLSDPRLQARRDVCSELLAGTARRAESLASLPLRIGTRQIRLILEWIRRGRFPLDDY